jgi:hypothetical protein
MDLPTHFAFALAVGLIFFDRPEIALLMIIQKTKGIGPVVV